ncbi:MAG TPA: threonine synthase [Nitrospirales bacterium]|nr:threonine synthase [Nitrospirales bacterium]HIA14108.1 threonine synthase [Nitrospirales bacterium]HIC04812.1 threonine synthase [Nitrospirales bacterium]HIN33099.1 threonine synthase [Nitrospirales bacterium]HIO69290.1 threonine synthase [Nitrospirales bacterium]
MTGKIKGLKCRECGRAYPADPIHVCEMCFGPLEVDYNYDVIKQTLTRESIEKGPPSLWRYIDLLPVEGRATVGLDAGYTPLVHAKNLGAQLGLDELYIKNDTVNHPTLSFKDRVVAVALTRAREMGFETVACASTGNLANAVAAQAAQAGMRCFVFIPANLEAGKVLGNLVYRPTVVEVEGNYDDVNRLCSEIASKYPWAFVNVNIRPYYAEGSKSLAYETVEQLGWKAPDQVVIPIASGSLLTKIWKGLHELHQLGFIDPVTTKLHGAQAEGCSPVATAFKRGVDFFKPVKPNTIAKSLAIGNPADGYYAIKATNESAGSMDFVSDDEIVDGIKTLAQTEGIFAETAGGVTIGVLKKLVKNGLIKKGDVTVAYVTGNGLKTQEAIAEFVGRPVRILPKLQSFEEGVPHAN